MRTAVVVAVIIAVFAFVVLALLGIFAAAGLGVDLLAATIGAVIMGSVAYFIVSSGRAKDLRFRILASVIFGLTLAAVLYFAFYSQLLAALLTGLAAGMITFLIYPLVVGKRSLLLKIGVIAVAAIILAAVFIAFDPVSAGAGNYTADATPTSCYPYSCSYHPANLGNGNICGAALIANGVPVTNPSKIYVNTGDTVSLNLDLRLTAVDMTFSGGEGYSVETAGMKVFNPTGTPVGSNGYTLGKIGIPAGSSKNTITVVNSYLSSVSITAPATAGTYYYTGQVAGYLSWHEISIGGDNVVYSTSCAFVVSIPLSVSAPTIINPIPRGCGSASARCI